MRLFAAIVPPPAVLEEVREVVQSVLPDAPSPHSRKGLRARFGGGQAAAPTTSESNELVTPTLREWYLPITHFGNVTLGDTVLLGNALRAEAREWARPELHFAGGAALEWPGDESVWVKLGGDTDALTVIGRGVPKVVQRLGYFVDRRQFRPWLSVGTITESTTAPFLQGIVDALEAFRGQTWTLETISLMKRLATDGNENAFEEMERLPLSRK